MPLENVLADDFKIENIGLQMHDIDTVNSCQPSNILTRILEVLCAKEIHRHVRNSVQLSGDAILVPSVSLVASTM